MNLVYKCFGARLNTRDTFFLLREFPERQPEKVVVRIRTCCLGQFQDVNCRVGIGRDEEYSSP